MVTAKGKISIVVSLHSLYPSELLAIAALISNPALTAASTMLPTLPLTATFLAAQALAGPTFTIQEPETNEILPLDGDVKVPVTLGVMSRCPDALICEAVFDQVLKRVSNKIEFELTYVAQYAFAPIPLTSVTV